MKYLTDLAAARKALHLSGGWLLDLGDMSNFLVTDDAGIVLDLRGQDFINSKVWDETKGREMKTQLDWHDLNGHMSRGAGNKCWPDPESLNPVTVAFCDYITAGRYREPSRAYPWSHSKPLLTKKFARWCRENHPAAAAALNLSAPQTER